MEDLSRRLGIAKSSIYHHVDGKEDLLRMALDRALDGLFAVAAQAQARAEPAIDRLEFLVRGSVGVLTGYLPHVTLLLRARGNTPTERRALDRRRQFDQIVADLVKEAERDGDIRPDIDPAVTARLLFGMVNSVVEWYRPDGRGDDDELASAVCAMAFEGLRIRRAGQPGIARSDQLERLLPDGSSSPHLPGIIELDEKLSRIPPLPGDRYPPSGSALSGLPAHYRTSARKGKRGPDRALPPRASGEAGPARPVSPGSKLAGKAPYCRERYLLSGRSHAIR